MNETRQLRSTWLGHLRNINLLSPTTPTDFERQARLCADQLVLQVMQTLTGLVQPEQNSEIEAKLNRILDERLSDDKKGFKRLTDTYSNLHSHWKELSNDRRQFERAITRDYVKLFAWRTAQAVMIAAIVLATAFTADTLNIPLPLLRL